MKNFLIAANSSKAGSEEYANRMISILEKNGCRCTAYLTSEDHDGRLTYADPEKVPADTEAILSLGGDGTYIHVAKELLKLNLPVLGVNYGTLGYLTEVDADHFEDALNSILSGDYKIEEHILLKAEVIRNGRSVYSDLAVNDIVMNRSISTGISYFDVRIDGNFLNSYAADGIILSTPTGSTGYNLSAGGPVVLPSAEIFLVTPLCAHTLNSRSMVFPASVEIELVPRPGTADKPQINYLTVDGGKEFILQDGDIIKASKTSIHIKAIKIDKMSFVEHLGKKMR